MIDSTANKIYKYMKKHPDKAFNVVEIANILNLGIGATRRGIRCLRNRHMINSSITVTSRKYWYDEIYEKNN